MTISHEGGGTAQGRIYCPSATNLILEGQYSTITLQYNVSLLLEEDFQEEGENRTEIEFKKKSDTISNKIDPINLDAF